MTDSVLCDFPPTDLSAWAAEVERSAGVRPDAFRSEPQRGLVVEPIYDGERGADAVPLTPRDAAPWCVAQEYVLRDPARVARALQEDRSRGLSAAWLRLSPGLRAADPRPRMSGRTGLELQSLEDVRGVLEQVRAGVQLRLIAGASALPVLAACAEAAGDLAAADVWVLGDPLGAWVELGPLGLSIDAALAQLGEATAWAAAEAPQVRTLVASGVHYHDGGASAVVELAAAVATGLAYLRAATEAGLSVDEVLPRMVLRFGIGSDVFIELAKLRAARWLWTSVTRRCGASESAAAVPIAVRGGWRERTRHDPWVNLLRATIETFAAATGGADEVAVQPYDEPICPPTPEARRWALGIQHVLGEESRLSMVSDPGAGSGYVESLTRQLAEQAWVRVQEIEAVGGVAQALRQGIVQAWTREDRERRQVALARGQAALTGTTLFVDLDERPVEVGQDPAPAAVRSSMQGEAIALDGPRIQIARSALARGATLGAVIEALIGKGAGASRVDDSIETIDTERLASAFERLRVRADRYRKRTHARPAAIIGVLGSMADQRERSAWLRERLRAAGFAVQTTAAEGMEDVTQGTRAKVVLLCGPEELLVARATDLATLLKSAGARAVVVTGIGRSMEVPAGITHVLDEGSDILDVLASLQDAAEVDR